MDKTQHQLIMEILLDCFEQGKFESFLPYLSNDIRRTSMWYQEDIIGRKAMKAYFKGKEQDMIERNNHYHTTLATLKYVDGQPLTFTDALRIEASEGSQAGNQPLASGTRVMMWYPENEPVLLIRKIPFLEPEVMIRLEIDDTGMVNRYHLVDPCLYAYEEVKKTNAVSQEDIHVFGIMAVHHHYSDLGYQATPLSLESSVYPHLVVENEQERFYVIVLSDHAPFHGKAPDQLRTISARRSRQTMIPIRIITTQVIGRGEKPHRILETDDFGVDIIDIDDLKDIMLN